MKYLRRTASVLGALLIFVGILEVLNYMYVETDDWNRIVLHNFYEDNGKIDNLYLGSSHVHCDINPMLLDELNGKYNFNLSTNSQLLNASYYLLREADKRNPLSHVYLELYYICNTKRNGIDPIDGIDWNCVDNMRASFNKLEYMLHITGPEKYAETLFPFIRFRAKLDDWDYIRRITEKKRQEEYMAYEYRYDREDGNGYMEFCRQGYCYSTIEYLDEDRLFVQARILDKSPMGEKSEKYLHKIICYCRNRGIPITLFVSPMRELQLIGTENYDNYVNYVRKIADEYGIAFYDFNLAKEEYLPIQQGKYYKDMGHLNGAGADLFTSFFNDVVSRGMAENEEYFYDSYAEKLMNTPPLIYGLYYVYADESDTITYRIASNREEGMEYRILITPNEGEEYMIQDFAENKKFTLSGDEHGICSIVARMKDTPDDVRTLEINY